MLQCAETTRLLLRKPTLEDAEAFLDLFSDEETCRMDGGYPPYTALDERLWQDLREIVADAENRLFIVERTCGRMIGLLHVMPSDPPDEAEIGYVIHRDFRRQGYGFEAVSALLSQLKDSGYIGVHATCYALNDASAALLLRLGFVEIAPLENAKNPALSERRFRLAFFSGSRT